MISQLNDDQDFLMVYIYHSCHTFFLRGSAPETNQIGKQTQTSMYVFVLVYHLCIYTSTIYDKKYLTFVIVADDGSNSSTLVHVVLCIREFKKSKYYTKIGTSIC